MGSVSGKSGEVPRWRDNGNGTVTDRSTGLIWLKRADWGGAHPFWAEERETLSAHDRAGLLCAGTPGAHLDDESTEGDWRLPTLAELAGLLNGDEPVDAWESRCFAGVQPAPYWSSHSYSSYPSRGCCVHFMGGNIVTFNKKTPYFVWPVRIGPAGTLKLHRFDPEREEAPPYVIG